MTILSIKRTNNTFEIIDQSILPAVEKYIHITHHQQMIDAIKQLKIRGAPAIGIAAVAASYLAAVQNENNPNFKQEMLLILSEIENSRPTAVNLFHATRQVRNVLSENPQESISKISHLIYVLMLYEFEACERMAENGFRIIPKTITRFLTHCNTGSLATYGRGTALGVLKKINETRSIEVYVDETRPLLQGARLTMYELQKAGIKSYLITDNMAAWTIEQKKIEAIIVGADRIANNGDTANKIGTYNLAILAKHFKIPFYVVAPESTIDNNIESGQDIIIEERDEKEVSFIKNIPIAPLGIEIFNPSFDITPNFLITQIITDKEVICKM